MLRTLPYHAPALPFSHTVVPLSASVVRPVFALASCESAYVVRREGLPATCRSPSFLLPARGAGDVFTWLDYYPDRANTALSPALRLLIDGMQLAF